MTQSKSEIMSNPLYHGIVLAGLFVVTHFIPFSTLYHIWMTNGDYSYGILIPLISLYFLWEQKNILANTRIRSYWPILPVLVLFILISLYGILGSSGNVAMPALPILIILFSIFCFGLEFLKKAALPLCFLIFMIPLPASLDRTIGVFLKSISSDVGGLLLRALGYSVYVSGNVIDLGVTKLQVVDACSGLRFVFPLLALGVVYSKFFEKVFWKQVVCVLITVPIAILTNILRIAIAGILTYSFGSEMAEGFFHDFQGWVIFMVAFVFLFLFGRFLRLFPSSLKQRPESDKLEPDKESGPGESPVSLRADNKGAVIVSIVLLAAVGILTLNTHALPPVHIKGGMKSFPLAFGNWKGESSIVEQEIIDASGAEEAFNASYIDSNSQNVNLYIGYRSSAFLEDTNFFHSPTVCLPSSGWKVIEKSRHTIQDVPGFGTLTVTRMLMDAMGNRQLVYFWFQTKDKATHDKNINRFHLSMHALKKDNTYDLFIRPITPVLRNETIEAAEKRIDQFTREMMQTLIQFLNENTYE